MIFFVAYATTSIASGVTGTYRVIPFWVGIGILFWLERIVSVRKAGPKYMLIASLMLIEMGYGTFLKAVSLYGYAKVIRNREISWA